MAPLAQVNATGAAEWAGAPLCLSGGGVSELLGLVMNLPYGVIKVGPRRMLPCSAVCSSSTAATPACGGLKACRHAVRRWWPNPVHLPGLPCWHLQYSHKLAGLPETSSALTVVSPARNDSAGGPELQHTLTSYPRSRWGWSWLRMRCPPCLGLMVMGGEVGSGQARHAVLPTVKPRSSALQQHMRLEPGFCIQQGRELLPAMLSVATA